MCLRCREIFAGRALGLSVILLLIALTLITPAYAAEYRLALNEDPGVFQSTLETRLPANLPRSNRWRHVDLNPRLAAPQGLKPGDILALNLFRDKAHKALIDRVSTNMNGTVTVRGRIGSYPMSYVLISTTGETSLGMIAIPETGEQYFIQCEPGSGAHYLLDPDPANLGVPEDEHVLPPLSPSDVKQLDAISAAAAGPNDPATIDVMVVYTPAARQWANTSGGGIANVIAQSMAVSQLSMDNSATGITMNMVRSGEVVYTESGNPSTDLSRLAGTTDGYMDEVHAWRNESAADIVTLLANVTNIGGIGYLLTYASGSPNYAFNVCNATVVARSSTQTHEMGHNMGCGHHNQQTFQPGPGIFSYSGGWRWTGTDGRLYSDVMTYASGAYFADGRSSTTVAYYSNPNVLYKGAPTGDPISGDNARTLRETKHVISLYRAAKTATPQFSPDGGTYLSSRDVTITCSTPGAEIHYTTNGVDPTTSDPVIASGGVVRVAVSPATTLKARAWKTGMLVSDVKSARYTDTTEVTIGTGTTGFNHPMRTSYHDARTQTIYLAGEIGGAHRIKSLALYVSSLPGKSMQSFTIRMKHTSLSSFTTASWQSTGWTTVYQSSLTVGSTGWVTFDFPTPFSYNGVDNLMVDFSFNNTSAAATDGQCRASTATAYRTMYYRTNSLYGDPLTWTGASPVPYTTQTVPNIRLGVQDLAQPATIASARQMTNGSLVSVDGGIVSAAWTDKFYIQNADRSGGLQVRKTAHGLGVGTKVMVTGTLGTDANGERYVDASGAQPNGTAAVEPVGLPLRALGGAARPAPGHPGVKDGIGLNNIGLLVTSWGKVTAKGAGYLYIDDGSGLKDGTLTGTVANVGVRVICDPSAYQTGDYLLVTGISSCFTSTPTPARCILTRSASDVRRMVR